MKVHVSSETLRSLGCEQDEVEFVRQNPEKIQLLVEEGKENGWKGPLNWMM